MRETCRESQETFARRLNTTAMTISRIERGQQVPTDFHLLNAFEQLARDLGLTKEARLFDQARSGVRFRAYQSPVKTAESAPLPQWRLAIAARVAAIYFPESVPEIERALGPALGVVDTVLRNTNQLDFRRLEREIFSCAEKQTLEQLKREGAAEDER
jgi:transcriptional regulator with XRE-family HTH domain